MNNFFDNTEQFWFYCPVLLSVLSHPSAWRPVLRQCACVWPGWIPCLCYFAVLALACVTIAAPRLCRSNLQIARECFTFHKGASSAGAGASYAVAPAIDLPPAAPAACRSRWATWSTGRRWLVRRCRRLVDAPGVVVEIVDVLEAWDAVTSATKSSSFAAGVALAFLGWLVLVVPPALKHAVELWLPPFIARSSLQIRELHVVEKLELYVVATGKVTIMILDLKAAT